MKQLISQGTCWRLMTYNLVSLKAPFTVAVKNEKLHKATFTLWDESGKLSAIRLIRSWKQPTVIANMIISRTKHFTKQFIILTMTTPLICIACSPPVMAWEEHTFVTVVLMLEKKIIHKHSIQFTKHMLLQKSKCTKPFLSLQRERSMFNLRHVKIYAIRK